MRFVPKSDLAQGGESDNIRSLKGGFCGKGVQRRAAAEQSRIIGAEGLARRTAALRLPTVPRDPQLASMLDSQIMQSGGSNVVCLGALSQKQVQRGPLLTAPGHMPRAEFHAGLYPPQVRLFD